MNVSLVLIVIMGVLFACGVYAMLERSLTRVLIGFLLLGNAANLFLLVVMGQPGIAPFFDPSTSSGTGTEGMSDPLPQALTLTAIVITFAVSAFLLALIYRSWQLGQADTVHDDEEDVALRGRGTVSDDELDDEIAIEDEDDDATTDFVGTATAPITVLSHRDVEGLRDDAGIDRPRAPREAGEDASDGGDRR